MLFGIGRRDFGFVFLAAAAPGAISLLALRLANALGWVGVAAGLVLVLLAAAAIAWLLARDASALRARAALIGADASDPHARMPTEALRTPLGVALARQLEEARRRAFRVHIALESRALEAERLIDALPEPILVIGSGRRLEHGNQAAERLLGTGLAGRNLAEALRSPDVLEAVEEVFSGGAARDVAFEMAGPVERAMRARIAALDRSGAGGAAVVLVLEDLTALRRAEQMRVDFVANVSHELRTPLASLGGFIETLQGPAKEDAAARERFLAIMSEQARRMGRLVDDLLSLSRIEMEEHNPPSGWVDLADAVSSVVLLLERMAAEREVRIAVDLPDDLPPVTGDADQVEQVLRNLVENAITYGRKGGTVRVTGRRDGPDVALAVRDDGEGIPRQHLSRLTERFYRMDVARSRREGGTGLGLAIVKHIVNRHRGRLQIESTLGQGSCFTTVWPVAATGVTKPLSNRHKSADHGA